MFFGALSEQLGFVLICQKDPAGGDECSLVKCEDSLTAPVSFINNSKKMSFRFYASSPFLSGRLPMRYAFSMTNLNDRKAIIKPPVIAMPRPRSISGPGISANLDANVKPLSEMPGSKRPWIFAVMSLVFAKEGMFKSFYRLHEDSIRRYGTIFQMQSPRGTEVFVADPDDAAMVLRADPKYPRRFTMPVYDNFIQEHKKKAGVFFLEGHEWHKHRSVLSKRMLKPPEINKYVPRLNSIVTDVIGRFERLRSPRDSLTAFEINEIDMELFRWSFESVTDMLFDKRLGTLSDTPPKEAVDFITSVGVFLETAVSASLFPEGVHKFYKPKVYREFEQNFLNMYYYSEKLIKEKMEELGRRQDLGKVNSGEDEIQEFIPFLLSSGKITREDLQSSIVDTLFAGVDTTSNTLGWSLYLLSKNPSKQQKLRDEIDGVLGCKEVADISSLDKMPYLKAVIKETLRIYPVLITVNRILAESIVLSGYHVPAGTHINMMTHGMGQLESLFPNAQEFMPERWLRRNSKIEMNAFSSLPFGFGTRMCLGRRLALLEMYLLLTRIIQRFELDYPKGEFVERRLRGTTIPDRPLRVKFLDRK